MQLITSDNAVEYLRGRGVIEGGETTDVRELTGGVSGAVFLVERGAGPDLVVKQSREQLRVEETWVCSPERIWRECEVMRVTASILQDSVHGQLRLATPQIVDEDRAQYAYVMRAAPPGHCVWKSELLALNPRDDVAAACGAMLGQIHAQTWRDETVAAEQGDRGFFIELRVDPYYRHVGRARAQWAAPMARLEQSLAENCCCLVHGDFSPKNLLVSPEELTLLDYEVGHFGDPAFDVGFFSAHLCCKTFWAPQDSKSDYQQLLSCFWSAYQDALAGALSVAERNQLEHRAVWNTAGCGLARLDGKSLVDYLGQTDPPRQFFTHWLNAERPEWGAFQQALLEAASAAGELRRR